MPPLTSKQGSLYPLQVFYSVTRRQFQAGVLVVTNSQQLWLIF
jgi:hypothetical protein